MDPATLKKLCSVIEGQERGFLVVELDSGRCRFVGEAAPRIGTLGEALSDVSKRKSAQCLSLSGVRYLLKPIGF